MDPGLLRMGFAMNRVSESEPANKTAGAARFWERDWLLGAILVLAIAGAYWTVGRAGFVWDDGLYITGDPLLWAPDGLKRIWFSVASSPCQYFPMVYSAFRFEYAAWGLNPAGYHWVNVIFHAMNALLLWRLLRRLGIPGAWLAAALFGLHPVQVESVAWVSELKNVLSLFFSLLSLHAWVRYLDERPGWFRRWDWLAFVFYLFALFSKTTACTLPVALLLAVWLKGKAINGKRLLEMLPFLLAGIAMGLVSVWWEASDGGTIGKTFAINWLMRILIASRAVWFYLGKLLWPFHLMTVYPHWHINPSDPLAYGWLVAAIVAARLLYILRWKSAGIAALFFVSTLSPLLGFFMLYTFRYTFVADHWQYVASIGPLTLAAAGLTQLSKGAPSWVKPAVCGALLLGLGTLTFRELPKYADAETLWKANVAADPNSAIGHLNLGIQLAQRGEVADAAYHYKRALEIDPDYAEAHEDLGVIELHAGETEEALAHFQRAVGLRPDLSDGYSNLGSAWMQKGRLEMAAKYLQRSLEISPDSATAHFNLGNIREQQQRFPDAIAQYRRAVEINPDNADAWSNLGGLLLKAGQLDEAAICLRRVVRLRPNTPEAHSNLGNLLLQEGREAAALAEFSKAAELGPNLFQVWNNLAWTLTTSRDSSIRNSANAVEYANRADKLSGGVNLTVLNTLAAAYAQAGDFPHASAAARRGEKAAADQGNAAMAAQFRRQAELYDGRISSQ